MMTARLELRVTDEEKKLWDVVAQRAGQNLSEFVRTKINAIIGSTPPADPPAPPAEPPAPALLTVPQAAVITAPAAPPPKPAPWLCADCARLGTPSCPVCKLLNSARR